MNGKTNLKDLSEIIHGCQGIEILVPLRNTHPGGLVRPPIYFFGNQPSWVKEHRYLNGQVKEVVLLDSIESQANRLESLLRSNVPLPDVVVQFSNGLTVSQYEAPHRIFDAIFGFSYLNGTPFFKSRIFDEIEKGGPQAEKVLFRYAPLVLLFGGWHSHGDISPEKAPKWPRLVTLEVIGTDPLEAHRTRSRNDPLGISEDALPEHLKDALKDMGKKGKSSELGLGQLPPEASPLDVVVKEVYLLGAISLVGLRNLSLDEKAKVVLLLLALLGLALQHEGGYRLRSGADFLGQGPLEVGLLGCRSPFGEKLVLGAEELKGLLQEAVAGLPEDLAWPHEPLILSAGKDLEEALSKSSASKEEKGKKKAAKNQKVAAEDAGEEA